MADTGRPPKWSTPEELQDDIDKYLIHIEDTGEPFLVLGFTLFCKTNRSVLGDYKKKDGFSDTVKAIHDMAEHGLITGGLTGNWTPSVTIFLAKNNHGYTDQQQIGIGEIPAITFGEIEE